MTIATNDILRVSLEGTLPLGQQFVNVFHFKMLADPAASDELTLQALIQEVEDNLVPSYLDWLSSACTLDRIVARTLENPPVGSEDPQNVAGNAGGTPHAHQLAALLVWKTGLLGRRYTGRTFLPPTQQSALANSSWVSGALTTAGTIGTQLVNFETDTAGDWQPVVWSETYNTSQPITAYRLIRDARTMTRRTPGFGS